MRIQPLSDNMVERSIKLVQGVFPNDDSNFIRKTIEGSLDMKKHAEFFNSLKCTGVKYWVAVDGDKVIGITGLWLC